MKLEAATPGEVVGEVVLALLLWVASSRLLQVFLDLLLGVVPANHYRGTWVTEQMNGHSLKK